MSRDLCCTLLGWAGWMPGVASRDDWQAWAAGTRAVADTPDSPPVDFIPALQRRRLSRLSRMALAAAQACAGDRQDLPTVFASRHGEIHRTLGLLGELARGEPLSPMAFSLSVHNTASGLYSIATGNTAPSTAIAAGQDTLPMAIIEAIGQLQQHDAVMVVYTEEPLPDEYSDFATGCTPLGLALLLGKTNGNKNIDSNASTFCLAAGKPEAQHDDVQASATQAVLRWLVNGTGTLQTAGERFPWHWSWNSADA